MCTKPGQHKAQSIQPSDMHTVVVHHVCHDIGRHCHLWEFFFSYHWKLADIASEIFYYTVSTTLLTAVEHVADDKFCFQQDSTLAHHACNTLKLQESEHSTSLLLIMAFNLTAH